MTNPKSTVLFARHGDSDVRIDVADVRAFGRARPDALVSVVTRDGLGRRYAARKDELYDVSQEPRGSSDA